MTRVSKRQQEQKSCGAATLLVTLHELTGAPATTNTEEDTIYKAVRIPTGQLGAGETLPSSVYSYAVGKGLHAEIIESPSTHGAYSGKNMYKLYRHAVALGGLGGQLKSRDVADTDLDGNGRLFLVVKFTNSDSTHYILARKDGGRVFIMNPDPGSDDEMPLPAFNDPISTNSKGVLVYDNGTTVNDATHRNYVYTGIAVRVWN